ncbi:putative C2H2 finger domain protein [Aspergillus undulatus]|uniref:putative C2H2 finger domain protein n=1 Tax=Aspergillus undulatus TaxID=1810928 RepID=UPI003CCD108D
MEDHYPYAEYHFAAEHLPIAQDAQYYPQDAFAAPIPNAMMGCVSHAPHAAVKGAPFPPFGPLQYPTPPAAPGMAYLTPASPFDESVRSISPQTDCQSSGFAPSLSWDDSMSSASGFESPHSPSYHESMPMGLYRQQSMTPASEPSQQAPQKNNHMFIEIYTHQPNDYMITSPTSPQSEPEPPKPSRKARKQTTQNRVQKRASKPGSKKTPAKSNRVEQATASKHTPKKTTDRRFECCFARYGCTSTFPSKNEWKRHVSSQHIQPGFFRCDVGRCSLNNKHQHRSASSHSHQSQSPSPTSSHSNTIPPSPTFLVNDFNRKDLFIQHQRRMHAPWNQNCSTGSKPVKNFVSQADKDAFEATLEGVTKRCWRQLRAPPTLSRCGFCSMEFRGANAWKERMEHVARHLEKRDPGPEQEDIPLREWAEENGVIRCVRGQWKLSGLCGK